MAILKKERTTQATTNFSLLYDRNGKLAELYREWNLARTAFYQAHEDFENAVGTDYIDIAILQLNTAEKKMDAALKALRAARGETE